MIHHWDIVVIGAGPGGLAAAASAKKNGIEKVLLIEREEEAGGILNQCIHDGFGLIKYKKQLSGPEYAWLSMQEAIEAGVEIKTGLMVLNITPNHEIRAINRNGIETYKAKAIILATGCRERTRGAIMTPGARPAGVFTAGVAQNLINNRNIMVGRRIVIVGSGDIGLIMARRLTLEGATVLGVIELLPQPCGLARNISQCLYDYNIPLHLSCAVINIFGKKRVTGVEIAAVDKNMQPIPGSEKLIDCDTIIYSVGLIPENEIALTAGVMLKTNNGIETDEYLQSNVPGIFSCGNCRTVMDLADFVSQQGVVAGENAALYIHNRPMIPWKESTSSLFKKGLPEKNTITCSLCPRGCQLAISKNIILGYHCERGRCYAEQELKDPQRIITTTVKVDCGNKTLVGIRSDRPVSLSNIKEFLVIIKNIKIKAPIHIGDKVIKNVNGVNFIAESNINLIRSNICSNK